MNTTQDIEIHPEIPRPAWATDRYLDDDGRVMVDEHEYRDGTFLVELSVSHTIGEDGQIERRYSPNIFMSWENVWPGDEGRDQEAVTLLPADVPAMIAALQRAAEAIAQ